MSNDRMTTYTELADVLDRLPMLCCENRRRRRLSIRAAAVEMGISFSTVTRFEHGGGCHLDNALAIMRWLDDATPPPSTTDRAKAAALAAPEHDTNEEGAG